MNYYYRINLSLVALEQAVSLGISASNKRGFDAAGIPIRVGKIDMNWRVCKRPHHITIIPFEKASHLLEMLPGAIIS